MSKINSPTRQSKTPKKLVTPSSRDSIASWLDVLTSMLSLSETQREQVRDELEDHIRSRVDDLLITGTPEPEAIRTAVAELGETAELAKLISYAHTRTNPRRRIMNIALITAAIAGLSVGGISWNNTNSSSIHASNENSLLIAIDSAIVDNQDSRVESIAVYEGSMRSILNEIASKFDLELKLSREARVGELATYLHNEYTTFEGEMTLDQAIAKFTDIFTEEAYYYNLSIDDSAISFQSYNEYQRAQIDTQVLSAPTWMQSHEIKSNVQALESLLSVKHDLEFASIEVIGDAIVVSAPPNIHIEVVKMMHELDAIVKQRQTEQQVQSEREKKHNLEFQELKNQERQAIQEIAAADFERTVEKLQSELDLARSQLLASKAQVRMIEQELNNDPFRSDGENSMPQTAWLTFINSRLIETSWFLNLQRVKIAITTCAAECWTPSTPSSSAGSNKQPISCPSAASAAYSYHPWYDLCTGGVFR